MVILLHVDVCSYCLADERKHDCITLTNCLPGMKEVIISPNSTLLQLPLSRGAVSDEAVFYPIDTANDCLVSKTKESESPMPVHVFPTLTQENDVGIEKVLKVASVLLLITNAHFATFTYEHVRNVTESNNRKTCRVNVRKTTLFQRYQFIRRKIITRTFLQSQRRAEP